MDPAAEPNPIFTLRQRITIALISTAATLAIRLIGPTLRISTEVEEGGPEPPLMVPAIYCFWHQCVFASAWHFRGNDIAVMTSRSFDGEYIARTIANFGFRAVRGSSSRGAVAALLGMRKELEAGRTVAFTIDGPRGPRHVAKPGPVLLAKTTGLPILCYHLALESAWRLDSWDALMIPKPFSRGKLCVSRMIRVPADADDARQNSLHAEMQAALERLRERAEAGCD